MTKNLSKQELAYNAIVDAINEQDGIMRIALKERNRLVTAAETLYALGLFKQYEIVGR